LYNCKRKYNPIILVAKEVLKDNVDHSIKSNANMNQEVNDCLNVILWAAKERHRDVVSLLID